MKCNSVRDQMQSHQSIDCEILEHAEVVAVSELADREHGICFPTAFAAAQEVVHEKYKFIL